MTKTYEFSLKNTQFKFTFGVPKGERVAEKIRFAEVIQLKPLNPEYQPNSSSLMPYLNTPKLWVSVYSLTTLL